MKSYVIGTGWWCDGTGTHYNSKGNNSSDATRQREFFPIWYAHIMAYANPKTIILVDSNSPVKPDFSSFDGVQVVDMLRNFPIGDKTCRNPFRTDATAAARQMYVGAFYAYLTDVDYFIWVEQDCLIHGDNIIETALESMGDADMSAGRWDFQDYHMELSFLIMKASSVPHLFNSYLRSNRPKPEMKYWDVVHQDDVNFSWLPFGCGRMRPIDFTASHYYAQHLTDKEIEKFVEVLEA